MKPQPKHLNGKREDFRCPECNAELQMPYYCGFCGNHFDADGNKERRPERTVPTDVKR